MFCLSSHLCLSYILLLNLSDCIDRASTRAGSSALPTCSRWCARCATFLHTSTCLASTRIGSQVAMVAGMFRHHHRLCRRFQQHPLWRCHQLSHHRVHHCRKTVWTPPLPHELAWELHHHGRRCPTRTTRKGFSLVSQDRTGPSTWQLTVCTKRSNR